MSQPPRSKASNWATGMALLCVLLLGGLAVSALDVWRAERALAWPTANGTVVESSSVLGCGKKGTGFHTQVRYTYQVGGRTYENRRIIFGPARCDSKESAKDSMDRFPAAAVVKVSYNPQDPADAVLIPGKVDESTWTGIYFLSFWFLLAAAATGMLVIVSRSSSKVAKGFTAPA